MPGMCQRILHRPYCRTPGKRTLLHPYYGALFKKMRKEAMIVCGKCKKVRGFIETIYITEEDDIDVTAKCICEECKNG